MGTYLHKVLEIFFLGSQENLIMEPLEFSEDFDTYALQRLKEILHALAPRGFVESPLYYQLVNYYYQNLSHTSGKCTRIKRANTVDKSAESLLDKGTTIRMRETDREFFGSIDALDFAYDSVSPVFVTDYKLKGIPQTKVLKRLGATTGIMPWYSTR